jgi:hypothetical protein
MLNLPTSQAGKGDSSGSNLEAAAHSAPSTQRSTVRGGESASASAHRRPSYESNVGSDSSRSAPRGSEALVSQPVRTTPRHNQPSDSASDGRHHHGSQPSARDTERSTGSSQRTTPRSNDHGPAVGLAAYRYPSYESAEPDSARSAPRGSEALVSGPAPRRHPSDPELDSARHHGSQPGSSLPPRRLHDPPLQQPGSAKRAADDMSSEHKHRHSEEPVVETVYAPRRHSHRGNEMVPEQHGHRDPHHREASSASRRSSESVVHTAVENIERTSLRRKLEADAPAVKGHKNESNKTSSSSRK